MIRPELAMIYSVRRADGAIKIGYSANLGSRFTALKYEFPGLRFIDAVPVGRQSGRKIEASAHGQLRHCRLDGEWFRVSIELAARAVSLAIKAATREQELLPRPKSKRMIPVVFFDRGVALRSSADDEAKGEE